MKTKMIRVRITEELLNELEAGAKEIKISRNNYINHILNLQLQQKERIFYKEVLGKQEKKEVESRVYFTAKEAEILKKYAKSNEWSMTKEVRYRTILSLSNKPKLDGEELKAIYTVRSSINVLGANINRFVRDSISITDNNIKICRDLSEAIKELKDKINYLEKCSYSSIELKKSRDKNGS